MQLVNSTRSLILLCVGLFTIMSAAPRDAWPCSCAGRSSVLDVFERSDHVLVAKVTAASRNEEDSMFGDNTTAMTVEKVYKGGLKSGESIEFFMGRTSCDYSFSKKDVGEEFLLYFDDRGMKFTPEGGETISIYPPEISLGRYSVYQCGRNSRLKDAAEDILYLDKLSSVRGKTRISGQLMTWAEISPGFGGRGITIRRGSKSWKLTTDSNGVFEIYNLPAGDYMIEAEVPDKWRHYTVNSSSLNFNKSDINLQNRTWKLAVTLEKGKHVSLQIAFTPDTAIRGRVLSPSGQPMEDILLDTIRIDTGKEMFRSDRTNKNGEFNIRIDEQGDYVLVVNKYGNITSQTPFRTFYYPGVTDRKEAKVFSIAPGTFYNDINFRIPKFEEIIQISATALYSDGKTVDNEMTFLYFIPDERSKVDNEPIFLTAIPRERSDEKSVGISNNGIHKTGIHKGLAGKLFVNMSVFDREFANCSEIQRIIKETGSSIIRSDEIRISGEEDVAEILLRFPFPYCEKSAK